MSKKYTSRSLCLLTVSVISLFVITSCQQASPSDSESIKSIGHVLVEEALPQPLQDNELINGDSETKTIEVVFDEKFPLKENSGQLGHQVEFELINNHMVTVSSHLFDSTDEPIQLSESHTQSILSNLYWLDLDFALAEVNAFESQPVIITLYSDTEIYELTYELSLNAYLIGGKYYYADHVVTELMYYLFKPQSPLAKIEHFHLLQEEATKTMGANSEPSPVNYDLTYKFERFYINDLEYNGWYKHTIEQVNPSSNLDESDQQIIYEYNTGMDSVVPILINKKDNFIFSDAFYFFGENYSTIDGIKVGLTKDEVIQKLGKANLETDAVWSYLQGDYLKFHLYYEDGIVTMLSLTMPL